MRVLMVAVLISQLACSTSSPVSTLSPDARSAARLSDAGFIDPTVTVFRDANLQLPDVIGVNGEGACRTGRTAGTVCAPNGSVVAGARISASTTTCEGEPRILETDANIMGYFSLDGLAPGWTEVTITTGTFVAQFAVEIEAGEEVPLSGDSNSTKVCLPANSARLAVLSGDYDNIGAIIEDLGFDHDVFCGSWESSQSGRQFLSDLETMRQYNIIFVNCASGINLRATNAEMEQIRENIRSYVRQGGSIYVSDLAVDWVSQIWPDLVRFNTSNPQPAEEDSCCVCVDCEPDCQLDEPTGSDGRCGEPNFELPGCREPVGPTGLGPAGEFEARVVSPFLRQFIDSNSLTVNFDAGGWVEIADVSPSVERLVVADGRILMVLFEPYPRGGRVAYTSFHNHVQATDSMLQILRALVFRL